MRDSQMILAEAQVETAIGDQDSTNSYDSGDTQDSGVGEPLSILAKVNTLVTSGGAATVTAVLQTSPDNATWRDLWASEAFALADLVAGKKLLEGPIPSLGDRYYQMAWRIGTAVLTAGSFDAWFQKDVQNNTPAPKGFVV